MCPNTQTDHSIGANYNDITRLLPLMIIVSSKKWMISIIDEENITINRQNRLIAHPYCEWVYATKNGCPQSLGWTGLDYWTPSKIKSLSLYLHSVIYVCNT